MSLTDGLLLMEGIRVSYIYCCSLRCAELKWGRERGPFEGISRFALFLKGEFRFADPRSLPALDLGDCRAVPKFSHPSIMFEA